MAGGLAYLDTSAFVKLVVEEPEQFALREEIERWDGLVSSALMRVEALRACARVGAEYVAHAKSGLAAFALLPLDAPILDIAARLEPAELRSLDALHLAAALTLADRLGVVFTYDVRLAEAARAHGLRVAAPA